MTPKVDETLNARKESFRLLVENVEDYAMFLMDADGIILTWNAGARKMKGYSAEEAIGRRYEIFFTEEDLKKGFPLEMLEHAAEHGVCRSNGWRKRKDGGLFWAYAVLTSLRNEAGELVGYAKITRDMTEALRAEKILRETNAALEEKVRERTIELENAMAKLAESNRELEQFAYVASHDLQEPLRKVTAFGERLRESAKDRLNDTEKDYLARMQSAASRMKRLIEDLLDFSRVSFMKAQAEAVPLKRAVGEALVDLEARIAETKAVVDVGELPVVSGNPLQLRRLFLNLLSNAIKYAKPGEPPRVFVTARDASDGGADVTVTDNGIGFDEKYAERIFKPFQRLHSRNEYEGTGLGLAITSRIALAHGGRMSAESRPGEGSSFTAHFPASVVSRLS